MWHRWFAALACLALTGPGWAEEATIAAAANFTGTMEELVARFEARSGHRIRVSYGSTGKLYAQVTHGAPYDAFLAADKERPIRLEEDGLVVPGSRFTYAIGRLVLWGASPSGVDKGSVLREGRFRRLALANPNTAPYGRAAQQVLEGLGLWQALSAQLVRGDSVAQAFQFVATGNAEIGFVARAQVLALPEGERGSFWDIEPDRHFPLEQQAVLLKREGSQAAARGFLAFLQSAEARAIIERSGYDVAEP